MNKKYSISLSLFTIALLIFMSGCGKKSQDSTMTSLQGGIKGGGTYIMNENDNVRSLDPVGINDDISHHVAHQIYDLLIDLDSSLNLIPALATKWEISDDGTLYTFHLRKGVLFHDNACFPNGKGREFTAKDVKYSLERVCDPRTSPRGFDFYKNLVQGAYEYFYDISDAVKNNKEPKLKEVSGYIVKDDSTFQVKLKKPFGPFIYYLCLGFAYVVPKEAVEKYGKDFFQNPVGTGPFVFVDWTPDKDLNLKKNPNYWMKDQYGNQLPYVSNVKFKFIKDLSQQLLEFRDGNIDESYRIPSESFKEVVGPDKQLTPGFAKFQLQRVPSLSAQFYGFLTTSKLLGNVKLRQAINYAIDRDKITKFVLNGQSSYPGIYGIVPPAMPGYDFKSIKGYSYDKEKVKQLLTEAGYPDGKGLPDIVLQINEGGGRNTQIAEAIQSMLKEVGINMKINQIPFAQHLDNIDAGRADFYRLGWIADYPDPENFLNLFYGKNVPSNPKDISPINNTRYQNKAFDELFEKAITISDKAERFKIYAQAEQIAINDAPQLIIFYDEDYRLLQSYVKGYPLDAMHRVNFRRLWLDK
ncbi:MAG: ABC transporter substrate-binding protein [Ignavibacteria bacterium]|nr:ABC transporter substrate-binding protein [Ignavibacteria bacterium]